MELIIKYFECAYMLFYIATIFIGYIPSLFIAFLYTEPIIAIIILCLFLCVLMKQQRK